MVLKGVELKTPISVQNPTTQYTLKKKSQEVLDKIAFLQFFELQALRLLLNAAFQGKKNGLELNINNSRSLARMIYLISRLAKCLMLRKAWRPFLTWLAGVGENYMTKQTLATEENPPRSNLDLKLKNRLFAFWKCT